jgi:uncharacterized phage-associated protein
MTTALQVANEFIRLAHEKGEPVSNMKLQKLVYFAQGFYAALRKGEPMFTEGFEAWKYGPVIPELYHKFKVYFAGPIPKTHPWADSSCAPLSADEEKVVRWVFDNLGHLSAIKLSDISHKPHSPWEKVYNGTIPQRYIPIDTMAEYFSQFLKTKTT